MGNEIKLDAETVMTMVGKSILDQMSAESKEMVLAQAVKWLLAPKSLGYGAKVEPSPLEEAYRQSLRELAQNECRKFMETDGEMQKRISDIVREGLIKAFEGDGRSKLVDRVASIVYEHIIERRY